MSCDLYLTFDLYQFYHCRDIVIVLFVVLLARSFVNVSDGQISNPSLFLRCQIF